MNELIIKYLMNCPNLEYLYSLFGEVEDANKIITRMQDGLIVKYIDGSKHKYSDFMITCYDTISFNYQPPEDNENLSEYENAQAICDWIEEQTILPDLSSIGKNTTKIEALPTNPQIAGIDENGMTKYMVGLRVSYYER